MHSHSPVCVPVVAVSSLVLSWSSCATATKFNNEGTNNYLTIVRPIKYLRPAQVYIDVVADVRISAEGQQNCQLLAVIQPTVLQESPESFTRLTCFTVSICMRLPLHSGRCTSRGYGYPSWASVDSGQGGVSGEIRFDDARQQPQLSETFDVKIRSGTAAEITSGDLTETPIRESQVLGMTAFSAKVRFFGQYHDNIAARSDEETVLHIEPEWDDSHVGTIEAFCGFFSSAFTQ